MTFRGFLMWVHLVLGLTGSLILAIVGITGAYITFQEPLTRWLNPIPVVAGDPAPVDAVAIVDSVEARFQQRVANIAVDDGNRAVVVRLRDRTAVFVDPANSAVIGSRRARFASLENLTAVMRRLHTNLLLGPKGRLLVTLATIEALLLVLTGAWLWWRKKHWQFRAWRGSAFRVSWDLHNASGIWFLVPLLAMVITGLLIAMPSTLHRITGHRPVPSVNPPGSVDPGPESREQVSLSRVLSAADSAQPGALRRVVIPRAPAGVFAVHKSGVTVYVDQFTGSVLEVRPDRPPSAAAQAYQVVEGLHTGELLGLTGQNRHDVRHTDARGDEPHRPRTRLEATADPGREVQERRRLTGVVRRPRSVAGFGATSSRSGGSPWPARSSAGRRG